MVAAAFTAGLARHGWLAIAALAGVFILARLLEKPWLALRLGRPGMSCALAAETLGQGALTLALYGLGAATGWLLGWRPDIGWIWPPLAALAAAVALRAIFRPISAEFTTFVDDATRTMEQMAQDIESGRGGAPGGGPILEAEAVETTAALADMASALEALPETQAPHHALVEAVTAPLGAAPVASVVPALFERARRTRCERDLRALAILVSDPHVAQASTGQGDLAAAFDLAAAAGAAPALATWSAQASAALDFVPEAWRDMPDPARLRAVASAAERKYAALADDLRALAGRIETLARPGGG